MRTYQGTIRAAGGTVKAPEWKDCGKTPTQLREEYAKEYHEGRRANRLGKSRNQYKEKFQRCAWRLGYDEMQLTRNFNLHF